MSVHVRGSVREREQQHKYVCVRERKRDGDGGIESVCIFMSKWLV